MEEEKKKKAAEKIKEKEKDKEQEISVETNENDSTNKDKLKQGGNNIIYAAKNKFRSVEDSSQVEIDTLIAQYNLKAQRYLSPYNEQEDYKENDIFLNLQPDQILLTLLKHQNEFSQKLNISNDSYKLKCIQSDLNGELLEYNIEVKQNEESNITVITFNKKQGDYYQFLQIVNNIHKFFEA